jgi:hypothetical protein
MRCTVPSLMPAELLCNSKRDWETKRLAGTEQLVSVVLFQCADVVIKDC